MILALMTLDLQMRQLMSVALGTRLRLLVVLSALYLRLPSIPAAMGLVLAQQPNSLAALIQLN
jgi:hypothetical protein